jgi:glycosylphosphatidylinositol transamidase (GPIT) subunit GPI8
LGLDQYCHPSSVSICIALVQKKKSKQLSNENKNVDDNVKITLDSITQYNFCALVNANKMGLDRVNESILTSYFGESV